MFIQLHIKNIQKAVLKIRTVACKMIDETTKLIPVYVVIGRTSPCTCRISRLCDLNL